jgi:cytoskeleton protein RodZ
MSVWQVEALEVGNYARLPSGTFLRGFVRNYAKVVGLPPQEVLARLAEARPQPSGPHIVVPTQNIRFEPFSDRMSSPYVRAAGLSALVIVLGFAPCTGGFSCAPRRSRPSRARPRDRARAEGRALSRRRPSRIARPPPAALPPWPRRRRVAPAPAVSAQRASPSRKQLPRRSRRSADGIAGQGHGDPAPPKAKRRR